MAENACHNLDDAVLADELGAVSAELRQSDRRKHCYEKPSCNAALISSGGPV